MEFLFCSNKKNFTSMHSVCNVFYNKAFFSSSQLIKNVINLLSFNIFFTDEKFHYPATNTESTLKVENVKPNLEVRCKWEFTEAHNSFFLIASHTQPLLMHPQQ